MAANDQRRPASDDDDRNDDGSVHIALHGALPLHAKRDIAQTDSETSLPSFPPL